MEECRDIPVIMLTGVENKDTVVESARLGICDYLLKPFSSVELLKRIRRVFEEEEKDGRPTENEES
jgi:two-component system cell cycle response regulator